MGGGRSPGTEVPGLRTVGSGWRGVHQTVPAKSWRSETVVAICDYGGRPSLAMEAKLGHRMGHLATFRPAILALDIYPTRPAIVHSDRECSWGE